MKNNNLCKETILLKPSALFLRTGTRLTVYRSPYIQRECKISAGRKPSTYLQHSKAHSLNVRETVDR